DLNVALVGQATIKLSDLLNDAGFVLGTDYQLAGGVISGVAPNTSISLGVNANGNIPGLGVGLPAGATLDAATGLILTLNEQILAGDPNTSPKITTTALHARLSLPGAGMGLGVNVPGDGALASLAETGGLDIYLAQSEAQLVPEASTYAAGVAL